MRSILLTFLAALLFLTAFILIFSISAYSLLYPETYIDGLRESGAFEYVESGLQKVPGASFIKIPEQGIEAVVTPLLINFLSYLRGDSDKLKLEIEIDMPDLRSFFLDYVNEIEICKPLQEYSFDELDEICRPESVSPDDFLDKLLESANKSFLASNFSDLSLVYGIEEGSAGREKLDEIRGYIQYYKLMVFFTAIIFLFLILAVYFTSSRDLRKTMMYTGFPVLLAGLLIIILVLLGASALQEFVLKDPNLHIGRDIISYLAASSMRSFYTHSILFSIIGICLVVCSFFIPNVKEVVKPGRK